MKDGCCSDSYLPTWQDLQVNGVRNVVDAAAESSLEKMFAAADQKMYWNSQDPLQITHNMKVK